MNIQLAGVNFKSPRIQVVVKIQPLIQVEFNPSNNGRQIQAPNNGLDVPGDLHKRFKLFKQKCELIFDGPLDKTAEDKKTRLLFLWAGDKGLEIYNTSTWANDNDNLKLNTSARKFRAVHKASEQ